MNRPSSLVLLILLGIAQLAAACWSIVKYETTLATGAQYRIRTIPVDPADAFRGRYVWVQPAITLTGPIAPEIETLLNGAGSGRKAFAVLTTDADGFASAARIVDTPPVSGDYLAISGARPRWEGRGIPGAELTQAGYDILFPFDRYYMNESDAPAAEERFRQASARNTDARAWLEVRVRSGAGVIEGLYIDGVPIEQLVGAASR